MIDINCLDDQVLADIAANLDCEDDIEKLATKLKDMSVREAFASYCEWNGLIGWSDTLIYAMDSIRESEIKK